MSFSLFPLSSLTPSFFLAFLIYSLLMAPLFLFFFVCIPPPLFLLPYFLSLGGGFFDSLYFILFQAPLFIFWAPFFVSRIFFSPPPFLFPVSFFFLLYPLPPLKKGPPATILIGFIFRKGFFPSFCPYRPLSFSFSLILLILLFVLFSYFLKGNLCQKVSLLYSLLIFVLICFIGRAENYFFSLLYFSCPIVTAIFIFCIIIFIFLPPPPFFFLGPSFVLFFLTALIPILSYFR